MVIVMSKSVERVVLAYTLHANASNPSFGMVKPVAEIVDDQLVPITPDGFCQSMKVFITAHYDELEKRFPEHQLFKLAINQTEKRSDSIESPFTCEYVSTASKAEEVKAKDYFEIIESALPNANDRAVVLDGGNPITRYIFINDSAGLFGPFRWKNMPEVGVIQLEFIDSPLPGVNLASYQVYQIESDSVDGFSIQSMEAGSRRIISGLDIIKNSKFFDYASDSEVIRFCLKLQSEAGAKSIEKSKADLLIAQVSKNSKNITPVAKQRLARLPSIVDSLNSIQIDLKDALNATFLTTTGKEILERFVAENESHYLERLKIEKQNEIKGSISELILEQQRAQQRLNDLEIEKRQESDSLQELKNRIRNENHASQADKIESAVTEQNASFHKVKRELEEVELQLQARRKLLDKYKTYEEIESQISTLRKVEEYQKDQAKDQIKGLNDSKRLLQSEVSKSAEDLRNRLIELKPFVDSINGSYFPDVGQARNVSVHAHQFSSSESHINRQREVVRAFGVKFEAQGRFLQDWEIANLLITTQQSFITVLAGLPGAGKTTLARLLAEVQGTSIRLQEVPVSRGWTSQKDLIGYFNPLTNRFQPSSTGLYDYLCALANEDSNEHAMAYTLLDEANLSPLEHYWSSFMDMADGKIERLLRLGDKVVKIPDTLRFMATINYDGTTEPLSQRLINRAPIIVLEESELTRSNPIDPNLVGEIDLPITALQMNELFGKSKSIPSLDSKEEACFLRIKKTLGNPDMALGRPISISPRKEIAIKHYCNTARAFMGEDNDLTSFDIAVLQHLLPLVSGTGTNFKSRLEILKADFDELTLLRSSKYLERMIAYGTQDLHSYDFFCW